MYRQGNSHARGDAAPPRRAFSLRVIAYAIAVELPYGALVPLAYLRMMGIHAPAGRTLALSLIAAIFVAKTALVAIALRQSLRPIDRWCRDAPGASDPEIIRRAGRAAYETPIRVATLWAVLWGLAYPPVTAALHLFPGNSPPPWPRAMVATVLLSIGCFAAALPLAYSVLARFVLSVAGRISLAARERGITIPAQSSSLAARLVTLAISLAVAPTSWMAAMIVSPALGYQAPDTWTTLALFSLVAIAWTPVCAAFLAGVVAAPFRRVGAAIEHIVVRGDVDALGRLPVHFKDEIGGLAEGVNSMVDRLQETSARIRAYLAERERLLSDAARRAAELQTVLDNIVEAVIAIDAEGRLALLNASGERILGLDASASRGRPCAELGFQARLRRADGSAFTHERDRPLARALEGEIIVQEAQIYANPETSSDVFLRTSAAPIRGESGAIIGAVAVARDVTEMVQIEQMKEQFIRVAAHELKTPVAIMKGYSLALLRGSADLPPARRRMLEAVDRGADRMSRIVEDILAVSQLTMDMAKMRSEPVDLGQVARVTLDALPAAARGRVRLSAPVGALVACGDAERIRQVLSILLDNALKYSPRGGAVDVSFAPSPRAEDERGEAIVSVRDSGVGIARDKQERIFELFFRAHTDTPHDYGGMGVGLYLAKRMTTRQGGRIWFESVEGSGTTFHFTVPLDRP